MLYAHTVEGEGKEAWQPLAEHLQNVASLSAGFADKFGAPQLGHLIGLVHDAGKGSAEFQERLEGRPGMVDHSTAGAKLLAERYGAWGKLLAYAVAGHHGGLPNGIGHGDRSSLRDRLASDVDDWSVTEEGMSFSDGSLCQKEFRTFLAAEDGNDRKVFGATVLLRMLYSCLVDADFLDTEHAMNPERAEARGYKGLSLSQMLDKLHDYMGSFDHLETPINKAREDIHNACVDAAELKPGVFSLSVGTGGGKTLAGLDFGLTHAVKYGLERVIYAIPYTSIVEQTAGTFKAIFGDDSVLEHHCNYEFDEDDTERALRERLASENWDYPLIVTTNVRLFESFFSDKPSRCRKNHNLAKSVIILDEVQSLPDEFLEPCLAMLGELALNYGSTVVLCTATQPSFGKHWLHDVEPIEMVPVSRRHEELLNKRVNIESIGQIAPDDLTNRVAENDQVLLIVSTRKAAGILYDSLCESIGEEGLFHLSALMVPAHRSAVLAEIRERLAGGLTCRVVSTQLVEAGVDLDFPVVYREIAGIDSVLQAAGRCNREGKRPVGHVYVFDCPELAPGGQTWLTKMRSLGKETCEVCERRNENAFGGEGVQRFFSRRYDPGLANFDKICAVRDFMDTDRFIHNNFPFEFCGENFRFIDDCGRPVFVPWGERGLEILDSLRNGSRDIGALRAAQLYTVSVPVWQLERLEAASAVTRDDLPFWVLEPKDGLLPSYSERKGLLVGEASDQFLTI